MTKQQLEYFLSAVEFCNLSKTAAFHYVSIPTLTRHINALEEELCTKLFNRSNRGLVLTPAGALFHSFARDTLLQMYSYHKTLIRKGYLIGEPDEEFFMGYHAFGGMYTAYAGLIDRYVNLWVKKNCILKCVKGGSMTELVRNGDLDVGAVSTFQLDKYGDFFESRRFFRSKCVLLVDPSHELAERDSITVDEITERYGSYALYLPNSPEYEALRQKTIRQPKDIVELCRMFIEVLPAWAAMQDGSGDFEPEAKMMFMASNIQRPELRRKRILRIEGGDVSMDVRLFWRRDNQSPAIARFKEALDFAEIR